MHSQRGSILVFVTLTVAVLMIFGVTFVTATTAEYRAAMHHTQGTQAFYVAEAGLNWARHGLANGSIVLPAIGETPHVLYRSEAFGSPIFPPGLGEVLDDIGEVEVTVRRIGPSRLELVVQGTQQLARRTLTIVADETAGTPVETALSRHQVNGPVTLQNNAEVRGDISGTSFSLANNAEIDGMQITGLPLASFAVPTLRLPSGLPSGGSVSVGNKQNLSLAVDTSYTTVTVQNNGVLMINVPHANDVVVSVGTLTLANNARINRTGDGTGRILLHIRDRLNLDNNAEINRYGHTERLIVYHHGTSALSLANNVHFTGMLVASTARVTLSNNVAFVGHIITGSTQTDAVKLGNNVEVTGIVYAPRGEVDMDNNAEVSGVVIAGSLLLSNNAEVAYATGGISSFGSLVHEIGLWTTRTAYNFRTWSSR